MLTRDIPHDDDEEVLDARNNHGQGCDECGKPLASGSSAEYPGGKAWPYFYCTNPECPRYRVAL